MLEAIERMADTIAAPLSAQPNAGLPRAVGDRRIYLASPDYMAQYARRLIAAGARLVGGCCGTTPEHIRRIRECVADATARVSVVGVSAAPTDGAARKSNRFPSPPARSGAASSPRVSSCAASRWCLRAAGTRRRWSHQARMLRDAGVDAVNLADGPRAQSRMGVVPAALIIEREVGLETVFHYTCRDRNMLGMLSDLLGAAAGGLGTCSSSPAIRRPPAPTPMRPRCSTSTASVSPTWCAGSTRGATPAAPPSASRPGTSIGVAANQGAPDLELELERFHWKVEAGAEFAVTQPVFDPEELERFLERIAAWRIPVIAGLWPLTSARSAEFLANEVPGVRVPECGARPDAAGGGARRRSRRGHQDRSGNRGGGAWVRAGH